MDKIITFTYRNHRGEVAERRVRGGLLVWLGAPGYGYKPGWFITGTDVDKEATRSFALSNIIHPYSSFTLCSVS